MPLREASATTCCSVYDAKVVSLPVAIATNEVIDSWRKCRTSCCSFPMRRIPAASWRVDLVAWRTSSESWLSRTSAVVLTSVTLASFSFKWWVAWVSCCSVFSTPGVASMTAPSSGDAIGSCGIVNEIPRRIGLFQRWGKDVNRKICTGDTHGYTSVDCRLTEISDLPLCYSATAPVSLPYTSLPAKHWMEFLRLTGFSYYTHHFLCTCLREHERKSTEKMQWSVAEDKRYCDLWKYR